MFKKKTLIILTVGLVAVLIISSLIYRSLNKSYAPENIGTPNIKNRAPDFTVKDMGGKDVKLSDFTGNPVVLNFWASWCPPCREEMPAFDRAYQEYNKKGVIFLMVDLVDNQRETAEKALKFVKDNNFQFNIYFDTYFQAANAYRISSIPRTLFIDKDGYILYEYKYAINQTILKNNIEAILKT